MGRIIVDGFDSNGAKLTPGRSVVRFADTEWRYHCSLYSETRDTVDMVVSGMKSDKVIILHERDKNIDGGVVLIRTDPEV